MVRFPFPGRDERAALLLDDLASALDAGLPPDQIGAQTALGDHAFADLLQRRGVALSTTEQRILAAAWQSGRMAPTLRLRAERRRQRAADTRVLIGGLRYPITLLIVGLLATLFTYSVVGSIWLPIGVAAVGLSMGFALRSLLRTLHTGDGVLGRVPFVSTLARERGELPYLEVLYGLYAAGVPLLTAHPQAVATCEHSSLRADLQDVDQTLQAHRPLAEALQRPGSLSPETTTLLSTGEKTGNLEEALHRALLRRGEVVARKDASLARWVGVSAYVLAAAVAVYLIFTIHQETYGKLLRGLRH
jgi:type II secretory pathway component PulF